MEQHFVPVNNFEFMSPFEEDSTNGLIFNGVYLPEELNGNGQEEFNYWEIVTNGGNKFIIEDAPCGSDPLPLDVPDFNGYTSCFATSYRDSKKVQNISLKKKRLLQYIIRNFMPHLYASEWVAGRYDCGCKFKLVFGGYEHYFGYDNYRQPTFSAETSIQVEQWEGREWKKVQLLVKNYSLNLSELTFEHEGCDTQNWRGHYGSKMAGGVVKVDFESIQPLETI